MSAGGVSWSYLSKDFTTSEFEIIKGCQVCAYSPKTQPFALTFAYHLHLHEKILNGLMQKAQSALGGKDIPPTVEFALPLDKMEKDLSQFALGLLSMEKKPDGKEKTEQKKDDSSKTAVSTSQHPASSPHQGSEVRQRFECIKRAKDIALEWYKSQGVDSDPNNTVDTGGKRVVKPSRAWKISYGDLTLLHKATRSTITKLEYNPVLMANLFLCKKMGLICSEKPVAFTEQDRESFGIAPGEKTAAAAGMSCFDFALLKTREIRAKSAIFFNPGKGEPYSKETLPAVLKKWGYTPVKVPANRDLVMYLDKDGKVTHLGCFLKETGKVSSKWGDLDPFIRQHDIFDVPEYYGNRVVIWHPPEPKEAT